MSERTEQQRIAEAYRREYRDRLIDAAEAFGVDAGAVSFTVEGETVHLDVDFQITEELPTYPSAVDVRDRYTEELQALAGVFDNRGGPVKVKAWSPDNATARVCDIPKP